MALIQRHGEETSPGNYSNSVKVVFTPPVGPAPTVSSIDSQVPWQWTTVHGSGFDPSAVAMVWGTPEKGVRAEVQFIDSNTLSVLLPDKLKPGSYGFQAFQTNRMPSNAVDLTVTNPVPLNLYWLAEDPNHDPFRPRWGYQLTQRPDDPGRPTNPYYIIYKEFFLGKNIDVSSQNFVDYVRPPLTTQEIWKNTRDTWCNDFGKVFKPPVNGGGHVNFGVATYEGPIRFLEWDQNDMDLNFALGSPGFGATDNDGFIKLEFTSLETTNQFRAGWWNDFRQATEKDPGRANLMLSGGRGIAAGIIGLDCAHDCGAEIHPVMALALDVTTSGDVTKWAIFVRNSGTEGYCGPNFELVDFPDSKFTIKLPWRPGATTVGLRRTVFYATKSRTLLV